MKTNIKNHISSTLFHLLKNKDFNEITISELSKHSNISRTTFYNNFNNIVEVLDYKIDSIIKYIFNMYYLNKLRKNNMSKFYINLFNYIEKNRLYFDIIKNNFFVIFKEKLDNYFFNNINKKNDYIIKSGCIINIVSLYLYNKISKETLLELFNNIK